MRKRGLEHEAVVLDRGAYGVKDAQLEFISEGLIGFWGLRPPFELSGGEDVANDVAADRILLDEATKSSAFACLWQKEKTGRCVNEDRPYSYRWGDTGVY